jgi:hypothetical protein
MKAANERVRVEADRQFHRYIVTKLGNRVLLRLAMELFEERDTPLAKQFATDFDDAKTWGGSLGRTPQDLVGSGRRRS